MDLKSKLRSGITKVTLKGASVLGGAVAASSAASAATINWTTLNTDVAGAMGVFETFVSALPAIIAYLFAVIIMVGIAYAIRKFANRVGDFVKV